MTASSNLHVKAARWFEQNFQIDEAFDHYITAGRAEPADALINQIAQSYYVEGRVEILLRWNEQLKRSGIANAKLSYICAAILIDRYQYDAAEVEIDKRGETLSKTRVTTMVWHRYACTARASNFSAVIIHKADRRCLTTAGSRSNPGARHALRVIGFAHLKLGKIDRGDQLFRGSASHFTRPTAINFRLPSCCSTWKSPIANPDG